VRKASLGADARARALVGPLLLALELPGDVALDEMAVTLRKVARAAGRVAIRVDVTGRAPRVELKVEGKGEVDPADRLVLDTAVATIRQALDAQEELRALARKADALATRFQDLERSAAADFKGNRSAAAAVADELSRALGDLDESRKRVQGATVWTTALAADLSISSG
jgi:hypothetical protein